MLLFFTIGLVLCASIVYYFNSNIPYTLSVSVLYIILTFGFVGTYRSQKQEEFKVAIEIVRRPAKYYVFADKYEFCYTELADTQQLASNPDSAILILSYNIYGRVIGSRLKFYK